MVARGRGGSSEIRNVEKGGMENKKRRRRDRKERKVPTVEK